ncbi:hypothetical protein V8C35DRAFT_301482 [Trichoderma chlorosporum]
MTVNWPLLRILHTTCEYVCLFQLAMDYEAKALGSAFSPSQLRSAYYTRTCSSFSSLGKSLLLRWLLFRRPRSVCGVWRGRFLLRPSNGTRWLSSSSRPPTDICLHLSRCDATGPRPIPGSFFSSANHSWLICIYIFSAYSITQLPRGVAGTQSDMEQDFPSFPLFPFSSFCLLAFCHAHPEATVPAAARPRRSPFEFGCCASSVMP